MWFYLSDYVMCSVIVALVIWLLTDILAVVWNSLLSYTFLKISLNMSLRRWSLQAIVLSTKSYPMYSVYNIFIYVFFSNKYYLNQYEPWPQKIITMDSLTMIHYMKLLQTFTKGNNFPDFQFALLNDKTLQNELKS